MSFFPTSLLLSNVLHSSSAIYRENNLKVKVRKQQSELVVKWIDSKQIYKHKNLEWTSICNKENWSNPATVFAFKQSVFDLDINLQQPYLNTICSVYFWMTHFACSLLQKLFPSIIGLMVKLLRGRAYA